MRKINEVLQVIEETKDRILIEVKERSLRTFAETYQIPIKVAYINIRRGRPAELNMIYDDYTVRTLYSTQADSEGKDIYYAVSNFLTQREISLYR